MAFVQTIDDIQEAFDCQMTLVAENIMAYLPSEVETRNLFFVKTTTSYESLSGVQLWRVMNEDAGQIAYFLSEQDGAIMDSEMAYGLSWGLEQRTTRPRPSCPSSDEIARGYNSFATDVAARAWLRSLRDMGCD